VPWPVFYFDATIPSRSMLKINPLPNQVVVFRFPNQKQSDERQDRRCGEVVADVLQSVGFGEIYVKES